ncbi:MAG TPA: carbohydrate binding domain-containing protein, partial [Candidatus Wunengus sp. YC61]|uniref:carbohydrate binding domain-containing protein n=1 Tax=Candidatus Wunengus sp. YC61 TaxID=3367698 RepID=UPI004027D5A0
MDTNNFKTGDPLFADAANQDFHLQSTSTAKDAGAIIEGITDGYAGSAPDIGAYEYGGTNWTAGHNFSSPPNPTFTTTNIRYNNLLTNAYFEHDTSTLNGWTKTNAQTGVIINDSDGSKTTARFSWMNGLRLGTDADGVEQTVTGLSPNTQYELRGFGKAAASGQAVRIGVKNYGGSDTYQEVTGTTWTEKKFTFTTGSGNTSATVYIYKSTTGGYAYADDMSLVEVDQSAPVVVTPTPEPSPEPGTTRINDSVTGTDNNQFEFVGTWNSSTNVVCYHGDNHWTGTTDSYYQVRFNGIQTKLYCEVNTNMGICAVSIDGGTETMVDTYSATHSGNTLVYTSPTLSS